MRLEADQEGGRENPDGQDEENPLLEHLLESVNITGECTWHQETVKQ